MNRYRTGTSENNLNVDPFAFVLPAIVWIFDCDVRRVYRKKEKIACFILKSAMWILFYALIGIAGGSSDGLAGFGS
jgi:hypothetical protein